MSTIAAKKKDSKSGESIGMDNRGNHHNKPKKISNEVLDSVRDHINSFEKIESHYCRSTSSREYLDERLNICKMYSLYKDYMSENNLTVGNYRFIILQFLTWSAKREDVMFGMSQSVREEQTNSAVVYGNSLPKKFTPEL